MIFKRNVHKERQYAVNHDSILPLFVYIICVIIRALLAAHHHCSGAVCQRQGIVGIVANGVCCTVGQGN